MDLKRTCIGSDYVNYVFIKISMKTPAIYAGDEIAAIAHMFSNLRFKLCYPHHQYDRLCLMSCKYCQRHLCGSFVTLARALFRGVLNVKVRTLNERKK
jgi:hypothetical protein